MNNPAGLRLGGGHLREEAGRVGDRWEGADCGRPDGCPLAPGWGCIRGASGRPGLWVKGVRPGAKGLEVNLHHPLCSAAPHQPSPAREAIPAASTKGWARLVVRGRTRTRGRGETGPERRRAPVPPAAYSPGLRAAPDLPPSRKQLMEAPLQTGMVKVGMCSAAGTTIPEMLSAHHCGPARAV